MTSYRLGVDIGGTFTDAILIDESSGQVRIAKVPSTPREPSSGFMEATDRMLQQSNVKPEAVAYVVHGTTVATNAIIEGKASRTGFITTEGFRDMLEIARQMRPDLYDLQFEKTQPLVPRYLCFGVPERLDARGEVLKPLDQTAIAAVAERLRQERVESVAVCLLHSYLNPAHERRVGEILTDYLPDVSLSLSSEVAPEFREYFRASTTIINASVAPIVARYLRRIENGLRDRGLEAELLVMQSSGGVLTFEAASKRPVFMVESGPAAGVIAAADLGTALERPDVMSLDMGGTTAKAALIRDGRPEVTKDYEVGATARASLGGSRGEGYPIRTPVIDLVEIGAGGGSIAWVDAGGGMRVGPRSAGADPGPACYGLGGTEPTITDANLVLGRLNPDFFLGGEMRLDLEKAQRAIRERCADPLGLDVVEAAYGIVEIANAAMVNALRLVSIQRGHDPREFALIAFGGAGPVHANRLADQMGIPVTVIPISPGVFSARGLLVTDLQHDYTATLIRRVDRLHPGEVEGLYREMEDEGRSVLQREGMAPEDVSFQRRVDMRYVGQSYELTVPLSNRRLDETATAAILACFHREHDRVYGFSAPDEPAEFVNLRLSALGRITKPSLPEIAPHQDRLASAQKETRPIYFEATNGYVHCPIYDRYALGAGARVKGPAIVEEVDSTTVVHPGYRAHVDAFGNLILSAREETAQ